ncbi:MAG TPA: MBL fold metallo-hydrolase [Acidimicrobiia bacterium]|jgi:glyoxylase-like metal-dependent hydrolase (beta-lactamase superfamily II)
MGRWKVGDVEVVRVDASNFVLPTELTMPAWAVPGFTPSVEQVPLAFSALAIRSGDRSIVVDPWIVDDSPRARPDAGAVIGSLLGALGDAGFDAGDVDTVVNTHVDGIGWNTRPVDGDWVPTFPRARYIFPAAEIAAIDDGVPINGSEHLGPLREARVLDTVELPLSITPDVTLEAAPGHNHGHLAVRIESGDALAIYPGHLVLSLLQVDTPDRDLGDTDLAVATATRRAILDELAGRHGLLLTTLVGGPGAGVVTRRESGYALDLPA